MFSQSDRIREVFAQQFQGEGGDIVYRKDKKGAPVRVSPQERDAFVTAFRRFTVRSEWAMTLGTIAIIGAIVALAFRSGGDISQLTIYVSFGFLIATFVGANIWAWYAPARSLRDRIPSGKALDSVEVRRQVFADLSYRKLATCAGLIAIAFLGIAGRVDILHGWGRLWLVFLGAVLVLVAVQVVRKWWFESTSKRR